MKVVLDTNVIVAAFAARGLCEAVFELCLKECEICISPFILKEVRSGLKKKIKLPPVQIDDIMLFLEEFSTEFIPKKLPKAICRDRDDDWILATAKAAGADVIVTGDRGLLAVKNFEKIPIVSPREFWKIIDNRRS